VGVMSLPRELTVAEDGTLESRPATELVNARSELLGRRVITDCDVIAVQLDARRPDAVEVVLTAGAGTRAVTVTLRGDGVDDVIIELGPEASTVREGQVTLAPADPVPPAVQEPAGLQAGPLHIFYDQGVLEVFGDRRCSPAAVICDRHGRYGSMQVDVTAGPGAEPSLIEVWRCGAPPTDGYRGEPTDTAEGVAFGLSSTQNELGLDG